VTLTVGSEAPDFTLKDQNGQPVTLSEFHSFTDKIAVVQNIVVAEGRSLGKTSRS